jgi:hypothetical protein
MTSTGAVEQAAKLLEGRLGDARQAREALNRAGEALSAEIATIEDALTRLRTLYTSSESAGQLPAGEIEYTFTEAEIPITSVRAAVKRLLDTTPRALTSTEIRDMIPESVMEGKTQEQRSNSVRSALWSLRQNGEARYADAGKKKTISAKWLETTIGDSKTTEGNSPDSAGKSPSDHQQGDQEGGRDRDDHLSNTHSQGHHLPVRGWGSVDNARTLVVS